MKSLDAFGRPVQEMQVKTACGGYLSVCSICLIVALFLTELHYFLQVEQKDEMVIDQNQDHKYINISLNVTFPQVPCGLLHMNLLDPKRANVMHVQHEIIKTRIDKDGQPFGDKVRDSLMNVAQTAAELDSAGNPAHTVRTTHATTHLRCQSCFQAHKDEDDCCDSCEDVRAEFKKQGLEEKPSEYIFGQCVEEAYLKEAPRQQEGCNLDIFMYVRKVPATIHIGIGRRFKQSTIKINGDLENYLASLDFSHLISGLSFGPDFPGLVRVLDGREHSKHKAGISEHYQYDVHVIPTRYIEDMPDGLDEIVSHQYSVTEYMKHVDVKQRSQDNVPLGLWLSYDFTPFEVKVTKSRQLVTHFLTECCAILGGIFAFTGMLDNFAYQLNKVFVDSRSNKLTPLDK